MVAAAMAGNVTTLLLLLLKVASKLTPEPVDGGEPALAVTGAEPAPQPLPLPSLQSPWPRSRVSLCCPTLPMPNRTNAGCTCLMPSVCAGWSPVFEAAITCLPVRPHRPCTALPL